VTCTSCFSQSYLGTRLQGLPAACIAADEIATNCNETDEDQAPNDGPNDERGPVDNIRNVEEAVGDLAIV
jgi:hypothetical protein